MSSSVGGDLDRIHENKINSNEISHGEWLPERNKYKHHKHEGVPMKCRIAKLFLATSLLASLLFTTLLLLNGPAAGQESQSLSLETHIPLPGVKGRIDHLCVDVKGEFPDVARRSSSSPVRGMLAAPAVARV
jgi:hypothetical protein